MIYFDATDGAGELSKGDGRQIASDLISDLYFGGVRFLPAIRMAAVALRLPVLRVACCRGFTFRAAVVARRLHVAAAIRMRACWMILLIRFLSCLHFVLRVEFLAGPQPFPREHVRLLPRDCGMG